MNEYFVLGNNLQNTSHILFFESSVSLTVLWTAYFSTFMQWFYSLSF